MPNPKSHTAYSASTALYKLQQARKSKLPIRIAFIDIDNTWTGTPETQVHMRQLLESKHYVIGVVTNRTSEMSMSWRERAKTSFDAQRPVAKFFSPTTNKYEVRDPGSVVELQGLLDPDIMITTSGIELLIKQRIGGYLSDKSYIDHLPKFVEQWRDELTNAIKSIEKQRVNFTSHQPLDINAPDFRVELRSATSQDRDHLVNALFKNLSKSLFHVTFDRLSVVITPAWMSKKHAVDHVFATFVKLLGILPENFFLLFAGDSMADAAMGLESGQGSQATFVIPGRASLAKELLEGKLKDLYQQMTRRIDSRVLPRGVYWFPSTNRQIVIGDEAYPKTVGPVTLISWLNVQS